MKKNEHESYWSYEGEKVDYKAADIKYNEIYNIEPSNILTESIFTLCLGFITPHRPVFFKPSEFNTKELLKLLLRNDLEDYEEMLTESQQRWINGDKFGNPLYRDEFKKGILEYKIQIAGKAEDVKKRRKYQSEKAGLKRALGFMYKIQDMEE